MKAHRHDGDQGSDVGPAWDIVEQRDLAELISSL